MSHKERVKYNIRRTSEALISQSRSFPSSAARPPNEYFIYIISRINAMEYYYYIIKIRGVHRFADIGYVKISISMMTTFMWRGGGLNLQA
jgi:hypothetical protein